jgi:hypothetical protein
VIRLLTKTTLYLVNEKLMFTIKLLFQ